MPSAFTDDTDNDCGANFLVILLAAVGSALARRRR